MTGSVVNAGMEIPGIKETQNPEEQPEAQRATKVGIDHGELVYSGYRTTKGR